jgi:hypothetical protein
VIYGVPSVRRRSQVHTMNFQITAPIGPFCRDNGVGRTKVYELIGDGEIESVTIGKKRYIIVQSYIDFLRRQAQSAPAHASPNPRAGSRANKEAPCADGTAATQRYVEGPGAAVARRNPATKCYRHRRGAIAEPAAPKSPSEKSRAGAASRPARK